MSSALRSRDSAALRLPLRAGLACVYGSDSPAAADMPGASRALIGGCGARATRNAVTNAPQLGNQKGSKNVKTLGRMWMTASQAPLQGTFLTPVTLNCLCCP